jgi:hypothetical protein
VTDETDGKPTRKLPERADALNVPLPFAAAIKAALETRPPPREKKNAGGRVRQVPLIQLKRRF